MPSKDTKLLKFDQYNKSDKTACNIYVDLKYLIEKQTDVKMTLENYSEKSRLTYPCRYSISTIWICNGKENKYDVQRGENCMKKFSETKKLVFT